MISKYDKHWKAEGESYPGVVITKSVAVPRRAQPSQERQRNRWRAMGRYSGRSCRLVLMCIVSFFLFVMELVIAYVGNSLSLASDAFAVVSHLVSMIIGLVGVRASSITQHRKSTFGFIRADVLGAFGNSIFAVALMFSILIEAIKRYVNPQKTEEPLLVLSAGIIGLFFNALNYVIFLDCCYCTARRPQGDTETGKQLLRRCSKCGQTPSRFSLRGPLMVLRREARFIWPASCPCDFTKCLSQKTCLQSKVLVSWLAASHFYLGGLL